MRLIVFVSFASLWLFTAPALAADAEKLDDALIVQGKVQAVFREEGASEKSTIIFLYEVMVVNVEKPKPGDDVKEGKVIYARAVHLGQKVEITKFVSPPMAFIMVRPAKGDMVRLYCDRRDDGIYRVRSNLSALKVVKPATKGQEGRP